MEQEVYFYNTTKGRGVITHVWITGGDYHCGEPNGKCMPPLNSSNNWNPYIDHVVLRFYVNGEAEASIAVTPAALCGVGPFSSRTEASFYPPDGGVETPDGWTPPTKRGMTKAPWSSRYFGKGAADGAWWSTVRIPFASNIHVTIELPPVPGHSEITSLDTCLQIRGAENEPIIIGALRSLPTHV